MKSLWLWAVGSFVVACGSASTTPSGSSSEGGGITGAGASGAGTFSNGSLGSGAFGDTGGGPSTSAGGSETPAGAWCKPLPACDAPLPYLGQPVDWNHDTSKFVSSSGPPVHRGRDLFLREGDEQWVLGKFAYSYADKDLHDEEVDLYLNRDCGGEWEKIGTATTTEDGEHETVEGVQDDGGRIYFKVPEEFRLGLGWHRILMVVRGDFTTTNQLIQIVPEDTPVVVSDVDGTLTGEETEEFGALFNGEISSMRPGGSNAMSILASKGYRLFYLTARPGFLVERTREFLKHYKFPPGLVHTTLNKSGALGSAAFEFKTNELQDLKKRTNTPTWAFGNTGTDAQAYEYIDVQPKDHRVFMQFDDETFGGRRIESYVDLLKELEALPSLCQ